MEHNMVLFDLHSKEKSQHHHHRETESQLNQQFPGNKVSESQYITNIQANIIQTKNNERITQEIQVIIIKIAEKGLFRKLEAETGSWRPKEGVGRRILK
jgi:hypothetical protein